MMGKTDKPAQAQDFGSALLASEGIRNPYPVYRLLRETSPVCWSLEMNAWLVTSHSDVREVYRRHEHFSSVRNSAENILDLPPEIRAQVPLTEIAELTPALDSADPPLHGHHRAPLTRAFGPRALSAHYGWLTELCGRQADFLAAQPQPDLIAHFTTPLSYKAILGFFGVPEEHLPVFIATWRARKELLTMGSGATAKAALRYEETLRAFRDALESVYTRYTEYDQNSIVSSLLYSPSGAYQLSDDERFYIMRSMFSTAHENLIYTIANTVLALLEDPRQMKLVKANPELAGAAYEEVLRWNVPAHRQRRTAIADSELGGFVVRSGDRVMAYKASANRDPGFWDDPDTMDITRDAKAGTLSFGLGAHFCAGAGFARFLGGAAVSTLLERFPQMALPVGWTPPWRYTPMLYLESLPLALK
jgi:cytochrome P450